MTRLFVWLFLVGILVPGAAHAQTTLDQMKDRCEAYGFVRGTPELADCVRKLDAQQAQLRCQALIQRGHQVCSKEYAELMGGASMAADCAQVQELYQQYCQ